MITKIEWADFTLEACVDEVLPNLWLGVTVCGPDELWKLDVLMKTPAAKRFVSFEPLLADLGDLSKWIFNRCDAMRHLINGPACLNYDQADASLGFPLDWVICGGETGPKARPMHPDWVRTLRDQCVAAGVPFFFKGWGEFVAEPRPGATFVETGEPVPHDLGPVEYVRVGKKRAGRLLDGREWNEAPQ